MWSFTGSDKQLWKWSESGNQLINVATGKPLAVGGFTEWRVTSRFFPHPKNDVGPSNKQNADAD